MATIWINDIPRQIAAGTRLSDVLSRAPHPCGGKGICGKCRVRATGALSPLSREEERHLTPFEIADGMRLSCCTIVEGDCCVTVDADSVMAVVTDGKSSARAVSPTFAAYGAAVDVGTTTIAARLCESPDRLWCGRALSRAKGGGGERPHHSSAERDKRPFERFGG